ncbi:hypothetical protein PINS_up021797 [Pythium insidiosum]|nr:hypothetical protein PINS_up021797 [Pythium insidiosum]
MEEPPSSVSTRDTKDVAGIALYPSYSQPPGVPTEWQQPFDLKRTTPLVFVAEKLLKRRVPLSDESNGVPEFGPGPVELDATQRAMAAELRLSTEKPLPKAKRERKRKSEGAAERPRKKKDATVTPVVTVASGPSPSSAKTQTPAQPRPVFVPSSTPPPTPQPARDAFSYYCQMFRENHPAVVPSIDGSSASGDSESPQSLLSVDSLQILYARAATHVQAACEQMAKDGLGAIQPRGASRSTVGEDHGEPTEQPRDGFVRIEAHRSDHDRTDHRRDGGTHSDSDSDSDSDSADPTKELE